MEYNRENAVLYAHRWAMSRNPAYYNFTGIGGDCANFASQCIKAGGATMNYTRTFGWYYINLNNRSPSWSGVQYLQNFLLRPDKTQGPYAIISKPEDLEPGDIIQLGHSDGTFYHTLIAVSTTHTQNLDDLLVACHTYDSDNRPLSSYTFDQMKCMHIVGVRE